MAGEKIVVPRWMSERVGVYDLSAKQWHFKKVKKLDLHFLPLSCTVYAPSHDFFSLGGLNEQVPRKPVISSQCISVACETPKSLTSFDTSFVCHRHPPMLMARASFPGVYVEGSIFALGGKQMARNPISDCEVFNLRKKAW